MKQQATPEKNFDPIWSCDLFRLCAGSFFWRWHISLPILPEILTYASCSVPPYVFIIINFIDTIKVPNIADALEKAKT